LSLSDWNFNGYTEENYENPLQQNKYFLTKIRKKRNGKYFINGKSVPNGLNHLMLSKCQIYSFICRGKKKRHCWKFI